MMVPAAWRGHWCTLAGAIALLLLPACKSIDRNIALTQQAVTPVTVGEATHVPAFDLAQAMLRAGLTREQILKYGPEIHTALATSGGVQFRANRLVEAVFAVHSDRIYVTSRTRGNFVVLLNGHMADSGFN